MFDELSTQSAEYQSPRVVETGVSNELRNLEKAVSDVLEIETAIAEPRPPMAAQFVGKLRMESAEAYRLLDEQLARMDYHAYFSETQDGKHIVGVVRGRYEVKDRPWWPNLLLLIATIFTTMWAGAQIDGSANILEGWPYALSVMLILGAHELGHYFAARHHKVAVTLPYFIPFPPIIGLFGTFGAFIQMRSPILNKRQLFDVGIAGPLAGLVFAVPILILGVATADVNPLPTEADCEADATQCLYILEGNSIFYATVKYALHGEWLPTSREDMTLNQLAFAGWTGLFVTALNLLPVGQLDGGHILHTLNRRLARALYIPLLLGMVLLALNNSGWVLWVLLLLAFGRFYATPLEDITPLDPRRRILGIVTLFLFILIFTPSPFTIVNLN